LRKLRDVQSCGHRYVPTQGRARGDAPVLGVRMHSLFLRMYSKLVSHKTYVVLDLGAVLAVA